MDNDERSIGLGLVFLLIAVVVAVIGIVAVDSQEETYTRSCMEDVHEPDPEASDYDRQALEFSAEIRKCMRG